MKRFSLIRSFNYAIQGVICALKTQRNMQIHFIAATLVLLLSLFLDLTKVELIALSFAISLVLICEMINTSIETGLSIISPTYNHLARMTKDIAAGAVLVATFNAIIVGYLTLYPRLAERSITSVITKIKEIPTHLTFISLILVTVCAIICKAFSKKKAFTIGGGMPSAHAAISFSIFTSTAFMTEHLLITILVFIMAIMVSESRIRMGIHTLWEIINGALLGMLITILVFQICT